MYPKDRIMPLLNCMLFPRLWCIVPSTMFPLPQEKKIASSRQFERWWLTWWIFICTCRFQVDTTYTQSKYRRLILWELTSILTLSWISVAFSLSEEDVENFDVTNLSQDVLRSIEADSFWCMSKLLDGIQVGVMPVSCPSQALLDLCICSYCWSLNTCHSQ